MRYAVLGPMEVHRADEPVQIGPYRQRAVLALLVMHIGEVVSVDTLIDELWSGEPPEQATGTLQAYISHLRRALEPRRARGEPSVLATRAPGYVLTAPPSAVDAVVLADAVRAAAAGLAARDHAAASVAAADALALWRGEPYADFRGERFVEAEVARLQELRLTAVEVRAEAELALGRADTVCVELLPEVTAHPLRERLRGLLMTALYRSGRQAEALQVFDEGRRVLADELGVDPSPEVQRLYQQILRQDPELDAPRPPAQPAAAPATPPHPAAATTPAPDPQPATADTALGLTFVGRHGELAEMQRQLTAAFRHGPRLVLVDGEPGIGKTSLVEAAVHHLPPETRTVWAHCWEGEGAPSMWAWVQVCRQLLEGSDLDAVRTALGDTVGDLAVLVPELAPGGQPGAADAGSEQARFRLYQAVARLVQAAQRSGPLLVVLEDVHWADVPTLRLLRFVLDQLRGGSVAFVATVRGADVDDAGPLADALSELVASHACERMELPGLTREEAWALLSSKTGLVVDDELVTIVHERTSGNPFFMTEFSRLLASEGALNVAAASRAVPQGVREVITRRVRRLPGDARTALSTGAVIGRTFALDTLAGVLDVDVDRAVDLLEPAVAVGLVRESGGRVEEYEFGHALVRETLYELHPPPRRARLHARVGAYLAAERGAGGHAAEIAHHFLEAGRYGDAAVAGEYALVAAEEARRRFAHEEAEALLRRALDAVAELPETRRRTEVEMRIWLQLGHLHSQTLGYSHATVVEDRNRAFELGRRLGPSRELLTAMWGVWGLSCVTADFPGATAAAERMLEVAADSGDEEFRLAGLLARGWVSWHLGALRPAIEDLLVAQALSDARAEEIPADLVMHHPSVMARAVRAHCLALLGRAAEAAALVAETESFGRRIGDPFTDVVASLFSSFAAMTARDLPLARQRAERMCAEAAARGFGQMSAFAQVLRGWSRALLAADADDDAGLRAGLADIDAGIAAAEASQARMLGHLFLTLRGEARLRAGEPAEALRSLERAVAEHESTGEAFYAVPMWELYADVLVATAGADDERVSAARATAQRLHAQQRSDEAPVRA